MSLRSLAVITTVIASTSLAAVAAAAPVPVDRVEASASATQDGYTFEPGSLADDRIYNFWVAGGEGGGLGQHIKYYFDGSQTVTGMEIWNGCQVDRESFEARARVKKIAFQVGFDKFEIDVADQFGKQVIKFDEPYTVSNLRLFLKGIYKGKTWDQIAITEIRFINDDPEEYLAGTTATASSALDEGDYGAANVVDTFIDSLWCEGVGAAGDEDRKRGKDEPEQTGMDASRSLTKKDGGIGEWVKVDLGGRRSVGRIGIVIGDTYDQQSFSYTSRPAVLKVQFSDGTKKTWTMEDCADWQYLDVGGVTANWIKFTIDDVTLGKRYNDTAIAEIRVWTE